MSTIADPSFSDARPGNRVPRLQPGDRLTRPEFERRFDATPGIKKAELIEGTVYMSPPVSDAYHGEPHFNLSGLLMHYVALTPGIAGGDNSSLRIDLDNVPQPDVYVRILESNGGQARLDEEGYIVGVPELVAEVAASSVSYDLHAKLNVYRRNRSERVRGLAGARPGAGLVRIAGRPIRTAGVDRRGFPQRSVPRSLDRPCRTSSRRHARGDTDDYTGHFDPRARGVRRPPARRGGETRLVIHSRSGPAGQPSRSPYTPSRVDRL
ncbi:MAG: hypothetical protein JWN51_3747 [Phycisphaerales bacterium]|nr:hypothetical protein [Phycisphaerales bacterium]